MRRLDGYGFFWVQAETPLQGGKVPGIYFDFATIVVILHRKMTFEMAFFAFFD
ncbi:unknown protein [Simkania negevensis Z]|uniref:Uncharacterized protein n=1 Tax=Simkania negevensis (strain ATCC VR-1471 / DSM 27360 / Z) TaxID=331113 RepID=F8L518_SIMNZ|nr:unknown protein [Simkania negevensis Z]